MTAPAPLYHYDEGTDRVPDDQIAQLHKDEAVLPVEDAEQYRQGKAEGMGRIGSTEEPRTTAAPAEQSHGVMQSDENAPAPLIHEEKEQPSQGHALASDWLKKIGASPVPTTTSDVNKSGGLAVGMPKIAEPKEVHQDNAGGPLISGAAPTSETTSEQRDFRNMDRKAQVQQLEQQRQAALKAGDLESADKLQVAAAQLSRTPWGDRSFGSKLGKIASTFGNIAGDVVAPNVMALIPGTDANRAMRTQGAYNRIAPESEVNARDAQTNAKEAPTKPKLLSGAENTRTNTATGERQHLYENPDSSTQWVSEGQAPTAAQGSGAQPKTTASAQPQDTVGAQPQYTYGKEKADTAEDNKQRLAQNEANFRENPASVTGNDLKLLAQHQREVASAKIPEEIRAKISDAPVPAEYAGGYHDPQYVKDLSAWTKKYDAAIDATPQAINAAAQKRIANNQRDESIRLANEKRNEETVQVFNPTTGGYDLMARAEAPQGAKVFKDSPQFEKSVGKSQRLEDVTNKMLDYQNSFTTNLPEEDRDNINKFIDSEYKSGNLPKIGSSEISLTAQVAGMEQMAKDNWQSKLSPEAKERLNAYIVARTTALEMQRIETDSGRMSQGGMELDLGAIPRPTDTLAAANPKFKAFNRSVDTFAKAGVAPNMKTPAQIRTERSGTSTGGQITVNTPSGPFSFNSQADADKFKKAAGIK